jgi:Ni/Fe-hydrogenase 1 B-type cytochrome subunit
MTESTTPMPSPAPRTAEQPLFERIYVWEFPVRIIHWVNALALTVLFATGLYIAHPVLSSSGEAWDSFLMGRVRQIHFATAYIFTVALFFRFAWFLMGNQYTRSGIPRPWRRQWWQNFSRQAFQYLKLDAGRPHLGHNALAGVSYTVFIGMLGVAQIVTGFALYAQSSPGGFWDGLVGWVTPLLGGVYNTVMWHHLFAWGFVFFVVLHVYIVVLDSREYRNGLIGSMIHGHKFRGQGEDIRED